MANVLGSSKDVSVPGILDPVRTARVVGLAGRVIVIEGSHCCKKANSEGDGSRAQTKSELEMIFVA